MDGAEQTRGEGATTRDVAGKFAVLLGGVGNGAVSTIGNRRTIRFRHNASTRFRSSACRQIFRLDRPTLGARRAVEFNLDPPVGARPVCGVADHTRLAVVSGVCKARQFATLPRKKGH